LSNAGRNVISEGKQERNPIKSSVPKANELSKLKKHEDKNFVKNNLLKVVMEPSLATPKPDTSKADETFTHKNQGKVPSYINKYNK
jgi:hypothetical protein